MRAAFVTLELPVDARQSAGSTPAASNPSRSLVPRQLRRIRSAVRTEAPRGRRYGAGFLTATVAALAALAFAPLESNAPFPLFLAAVAIATWFGGLGPC